jgi:hypothetical protein
MQPVYEPNSTEPSEESEEEEDTADIEEELEDSGEVEEETIEEPSNNEMPELSPNTGEPVKSCNSTGTGQFNFMWIPILGAFLRRIRW